VLFQYWTGEDTDATIVADEQGYIYVCQHSDNHPSVKHRHPASEGGRPDHQARPSRLASGENPLLWVATSHQTYGNESVVWRRPRSTRTWLRVQLTTVLYLGSIDRLDRSSGGRTLAITTGRAASWSIHKLWWSHLWRHP